MSSQAVNFEGTTFHFPSDAKDEEILSFLKENVPSPSSGNLPKVPSPTLSINPQPDRSLGAKAGYVINDIEQRNPELTRDLGRDLGRARDFVGSTARSVASITPLGIASGISHRPISSLPGLGDVPALQSPIDLRRETVPNAVLSAPEIAGAGGLASEAEAGVGSRAGTSTRTSEPVSQIGNVGNRAPSVPTPTTGSAISASDASPLITKQEAWDIGSGVLTKSPTRVFRGVQSLLKRRADSATVEGTTQATPQDISLRSNNTTVRPPSQTPPPSTVPHPTAKTGTWPASSTLDFNADTATRPPKPPLVRNPPAWKSGNQPAPTEVPSVLGGHVAPDPNRIVFHGTEAKNAQSILQRGIKANPAEPHETGPWVTPFKQEATRYAEIGDHDPMEYIDEETLDDRPHVATQQGHVFAARVPQSHIEIENEWIGTRLRHEIPPNKIITGHSGPTNPPTRIPAWKTGTETGGEVVPSVAPHTQGRLTEPDIQNMLERTGPPRGGKGQIGRAILRKNVKGLAESQNPEGEGPPRPGTGPGAQLGSPESNSIIDQFERDRDAREQSDILGGTERRVPLTRDFHLPSEPTTPPPLKRSATSLQRALHDYDTIHPTHTPRTVASPTGANKTHLLRHNDFPGLPRARYE